MFKSNEEMIAENMPDDNTILILRKDLQTRSGMITKYNNEKKLLKTGAFSFSKCKSCYNSTENNNKDEKEQCYEH